MSGILKAMNNGLRQQSFARRAVIKVSCSSNIVPSVVFCTTLKSMENSLVTYGSKIETQIAFWRIFKQNVPLWS